MEQNNQKSKPSKKQEPTLLEYIWIDDSNNLRGKTMVYRKPFKTAADLPVWNYDELAYKERGLEVVVMLRPVALFPDPFRGGHHKLVLTEKLDLSFNPHFTNHRAKAVEILEKAAKHEPMFGIEQEYFLLTRNQAIYEYTDKDGTKKAERQYLPYKWLGHGNPGGGGKFHSTSVGGEVAYGREVAEEHLAACLKAGLEIWGINSEGLASQWEYQIGICDGIEISDQIWIARYILHRITEPHNLIANMECKPYKNFYGNGLHTNFSTKAMREGADGKKGIEFIREACIKLSKPETHKRHLEVYGEGNLERLIGNNTWTASHETCTWAEHSKDVSLRIPVDTVNAEQGYFEDRRVGANADPYQVVTVLVQSILLDDE